MFHNYNFVIIFLMMKDPLDKLAIIYVLMMK